MQLKNYTVFLHAAPDPVPGSLDKKGGRKIPSMFHLCLIKDVTAFPLFCLTNPALSSVPNICLCKHILIFVCSVDRSVVAVALFPS
jgi:hypothetical protein